MSRLILPALLLASPPTLAQVDPDAAAEAAFDEAFGDSFDEAFDDPFGDDSFGDDPFGDFDDGFGEDERGLILSGFVEGAYGRRLDADPLFATRQSLGDLRVRAETEWVTDKLVFTLKADALYDDYLDELDVEPRDLSFRFSPGSSVDIKIGRQVLTWGTGDLLFLNDLFPKSWVSFFSGRDDEYLKAPSDAVRATWYTSLINIDLAWSPEFDPDDYLTGSRFSFFSPLAETVVAPRPPLSADAPSSGIEDGELAMRLFRTSGSTEYAAYLYRGFFKQPLGLTPSLAPAFPRLRVVGASLRRPLGQGLVNAEFAYHDSRSDRSGSNPLVPNSQLRLLVGFEFEALTRLNVGFQLYVEQTRNHGAQINQSPTPAFEPDRTRHVVTNRLTYRDSRDRLTLSLFSFYSASDNDYYLRPSVSYRQSDSWTFSAGANLFGGNREHTFFGQLEDNSNAYFRVRYNY